MAYSFVKYFGNGTQTDFSFPFPYLEPENITASVNSVDVLFSFLGTNLIRLAVAPASEATVNIRRQSATGALPVEFTDGSVLLERDLDRLARFVVYAAQEAADGGSASGGAFSGTIAQALSALTGQITLSQFATSIQNEIALISGTSEVIGSAAYRVLQETLARQAADGAMNTRVTGLEALGAATYNDAPLTARVANVETAQVDGDTALAGRATVLEAKVDIAQGQSLSALLSAESTARVNADSANATSITNVQAAATSLTGRVGNVETSNAATVNSMNVVNANSTLKVQARSDGKLAIAGIGLNATTNGVTTQSEVILMADKLQFVSSVAGINEVPQVLLQAGIVNGANTLVIPATRIGDKVVDARMAVDGFLVARHVAAQTITAVMIDSRGLSIKDALGNVILAAGSQMPASYVVPDASWLNSNVSLGGLGYSGAVNATYGATFGVNVGGQITSGSATTYIADGAMGTLQIAGQAVTVPIGASVSADVLNPENILENTVLTVGSVDSAGNPIFVIAALTIKTISGGGASSVTLRIRVGGVVVYSVPLVIFGTMGAGAVATQTFNRNVYIAAPGTGSKAVIVTLQSDTASHADGGTCRLSTELSGSTVFAMGCKR